MKTQRVKRSQALSSLPEFDFEWVIALIDGHVFIQPEPDEALIETMWKKHKGYLMALWYTWEPFMFDVRTWKGSPGSRPWGWWAYEAPEPRKQVSGVESASDLKYFGMPFGYSEKIPDVVNFPRFETQKKYLERLGLLTPGEQDYFLEGGKFIHVMESPDNIDWRLPYTWQQEALKRYRSEHNIKRQ